MRNLPDVRRRAPVAAPRDRQGTPAWWENPSTDVAVGVFALASLVATQMFGTLGAAAFVVSVMLLVAMRPGETLRDLVTFSPLLILPLLAMVSALWSPAPQLTMRAAIQILATVVAAILVARRVPARTMILVLFVGYVVICLLLLPAAFESLSSGFPLYSALLGSKNQAGFAAHMLLALALGTMFDRDQLVVARIAAIFALPLGLFIIYLSQSGGAYASLLITLVTFAPLFVLAKVKPALRVACMAVALLGLVAALIFLPAVEAAMADFRVNVLKKDATLTGRTHLWEVASQISAKNPWLGEGYGAFWRHGNLDAEGLWRWAGIANRSGFNFHSAFVEMRVDLGWVGMGVLIATCAGVALTGLARLMIRPTVPMAFLLSLLAVLYARSLTESGLVAPFALPTVLWIATAVYAASALGVRFTARRSEPRSDTRVAKSGLTVRRL